MKPQRIGALISACWLWLAFAAEPVRAQSPAPDTNGPGRVISQGEAASVESTRTNAETWNWHVQNTAIIQGTLPFPAKYSGPNSLDSQGETRETVSLDLMAGVRLWPGAEGHVDGLMWQGYGLSTTLGVEGFPNGEGFRLGTKVPNVTFSRLFLRQTIGLGGDQEDVPDDGFHLGGKVDVSRITLTVGKLSAKDIFDNNAYANDPRTQFLNWAFMANEAWDYPADSLGFITGFAAELNQPSWAARYGLFQMPRVSNGTALDQNYLQAWGMVTEFERRFVVGQHPGTVRLLSYLNSAHMGSYAEAVANPERPADIEATRSYRTKYGFGLNLEQEIVTNLGVFSRVGWSDGRNEAWVFADVDHTASLGLSLKGGWWQRPDDTFGLAGALNDISRVHQEFLEAGGTGILAGDGTLTYGIEKIIETYYDAHIWKSLHVAFNYQFIVDPAYNRDRGPVSVFAGRLHFEF
jgi:high affinity Mn2+ porin